MIGNQDVQQIEGATAYDAEGRDLGRVDKVYVDDQTGQPSWVSVDAGVVGSRSLVPVHDASTSGDGLRLGYSADVIAGAPGIPADEHLDPAEEQRLLDYYESRGVGQRVTTAPTAGSGDGVVTLHEERLRAGVQRVPVERVRIRRYVEEDVETVTVPILREKLVVEQVPVTDGVAGDAGGLGSGLAGSGEAREFVLREERAVVTKEVVVSERVIVRVDTVTETQQVTDTVRKEQADIETTGGVQAVGGTGTTGTGTTGTGGLGTSGGIPAR